MKKRLLALLLIALLCLSLTACGAADELLDQVEQQVVQDLQDTLDETLGDTLELIEDTAAPEEPAPAAGPEETPETPAVTEEPEAPAEPAAEETEAPAPAEEAPAVAEDGEYTSPEDVALYLHLYGHLPDNFITKNKARDLGWDSSAGNLWDVAPGKSIGGDRFGNYEGLLPDGDYRECDVNYTGGYRGAERLIYGEDGSVYYTNDHYKTFTQLY